MPTTKASIDILVKGHPVTLKYKNQNNGMRNFFVNGKQVNAEFDSIMDTSKIFILGANICDNMVIDVID